ncbi:OTU domain-containing protein 4 [Austrofundulus limnaeus]|uniref:ubiquitinyl hydrolase 1 n=1 Tax=Austrofundulus limnaeus TaxID=52670 RepID=A0A2I4AVM1_AUSLI|nr:PREDICTED: OTU domain-containing protein 4 [Austrofundulus limnaeus]
MDSGGNMQSNEERSVERAMDNYLKSIGLHRKKIAKDGSCLFRAVAEQVLHCQSLHTEVRSKCVQFLKENRDSYEAFIEGNFEEYLLKLQDPQQWVGEVEINALAIIYKRDFQIFQEPGRPAVNITDNNFKDKVQLCFLNGNHYDSVYPINRIKNSGVCQSILYELLYDGVFKVERGALAPCQRSSRPNDFLSDDAMYPYGSSDESEPDTGEPLWVQAETSTASSRSSSHGYRGRGRCRQLPERVRRSLNPTLLRNVQYDIWQKSKKAQHKMDYSIAAGMQFSVGDRCQVRLESGGRSYNATIKDVPSTSGPVTVYIDELGTRQVALWSLRPPITENSWSTVVREKRLNNGHGDWEDRGKGRGRGKSTSASSSSVSQAPPPGSGGRVQKQHSWPPQAAVEEKGEGKPSRKSIDSEEPSLLSKAERLAEEEELRSALVAIQLQDENSFPALGTQAVTPAEGGRRKSGEKRRSQRSKTKSPDEDVVSTPPDGEKLKSSTPPPRPPAATTLPVGPAPPPDKAADSVGRSSVNPVASGPAPSAPPTKPNAQSYASAAAAPTSPPNVKSSVPSSAGIFSFITPVLPAASTPPASSSSPPPLPPSSSAPRLTFIAPIAPCPAVAPGFLRSFSPVTTLPPSPSPPPSSSSSAVPPQAPPATSVLLKPEASRCETLGSQTGPNVAQEDRPPQLSLHQVQTQSQDLQNQHLTPQNQTQVHQNQTQVHQNQTQVHQNQAQVHQNHLPQLPALPQALPGTFPVLQLFHDPLYPGFPQGENGEVQQIPPFSTSRVGDDLPKDINVLRFFFNLGVKRKYIYCDSTA